MKQCRAAIAPASAHYKKGYFLRPWLQIWLVIRVEDTHNEELAQQVKAPYKPPLRPVIDFLKSQRAPLHNGELASEVFECCKRLTRDELLQLGNELTRISQKPQATHQAYVSAFRRCQYAEDSLFQTDDCSLHALLAFVRGEIGIMALSQLMLYDECLRTTSGATVKAYSVTDSASIDLLYQSLGSHEADSAKSTLKKQLLALPPSEGSFFSIPISSLDDKMGQLLCKTSHELHLPIFVTYNPEPVVLIVPPRIVWEILKAKFGKLAMMPNPVLGYSRAVDFSLVDKRDVALPCRLTTCPPAFSPISLYHHDSAYHLFLDSANCHRAAWIELANTIRKDLESEEIYADLLDREFLYYYFEGNNEHFEQTLNSPSLLFWGTLVHSVVYNDHFTTDTKDQFLAVVAKYILEHQDKWQEKYKIFIDDLQKLTSKDKSLSQAHQQLMEKIARSRGQS